MIKIIASATVEIRSKKRNRSNNKYIGLYKIQNQTCPFTLLYHRRRKAATFSPPIIHSNHKEYLAEVILKQSGDF
jgi:hypothetical protein